MNTTLQDVCRIGSSGLLLLLLLLLLVGATSVEAQTNAATPVAKYTEEGTERCLACHGGEKMTLIADSPHGNKENAYTPYAQMGCESCHGKGSLHVSRARGGAGFPALIRFSADGSPLPRQNESCLNCHAQAMGSLEGMAWAGSLHDNGKITCGTCHSIHTAENGMTNAAKQKTNCSGCHEAQIATHPKFESKGIVFDKLACGDCHDVHQLEHRSE